MAELSVASWTQLMGHLVDVAAANKSPYGNVTYADPGYQSDKKKRYPIDTEGHVRAALSYIGQSKDSSKYTPAQLSSIKAKINAAAKKFGVKVS